MYKPVITTTCPFKSFGVARNCFTFLTPYIKASKPNNPAFLGFLEDQEDMVVSVT